MADQDEDSLSICLRGAKRPRVDPFGAGPGEGVLYGYATHTANTGNGGDRMPPRILCLHSKSKDGMRAKLVAGRAPYYTSS